MAPPQTDCLAFGLVVWPLALSFGLVAWFLALWSGSSSGSSSETSSQAMLTASVCRWRAVLWSQASRILEIFGTSSSIVRSLTLSLSLSYSLTHSLTHSLALSPTSNGQPFWSNGVA